ncbi:uncharacterized protein CBL_07480 [Carabus blaptoides fortunei]
MKQNKILLRKKRFLTFPKGSNLVMTVVGLKEIMLKIPKGYRTTLECDATFKLPSASHRSYLKKLAMHTRQRREVHDGISKTVDMFGFNGNACIKKTICEAQYLAPFRGNSLFRQILFTIFMNPQSESEAENYCSKEVYNECDMSLLGIMLNHIIT